MKNCSNLEIDITGGLFCIKDEVENIEELDDKCSEFEEIEVFYDN
nr:hypothetical protein [uncultured Fusobacterium sp.]